MEDRGSVEFKEWRLCQRFVAPFCRNVTKKHLETGPKQLLMDAVDNTWGAQSSAWSCPEQKSRPSQQCLCANRAECVCAGVSAALLKSAHGWLHKAAWAAHGGRRRMEENKVGSQTGMTGLGETSPARFNEWPGGTTPPPQPERECSRSGSFFLWVLAKSKHWSNQPRRLQIQREKNPIACPSERPTHRPLTFSDLS